MAGFNRNFPAIKASLTANEPEVRVAALGAAWRSGLLTPENILPFFSDPSDDVRYRAVELSPRLKDNEGLAPALVLLLRQPELAEVAAFALGELGVTTDDVVTALSNQAVDHDEPLCRESAVAALGALGCGRQAVLAATKDIATVRRRAVLCLAVFEGPDIDAALSSALNDRDWQVRQAAEDLLGPASSTE